MTGRRPLLDTARLAVALLLAAFAAPLIAQPGERTPLTIDATRPGPTISRDVFGQFAEMLGEGIYGGVWVGPDSKIPNVRGIRSDVVKALRVLKVPNVRWPGGCHGDRYDWRDGIGPASARRARISMWGNVLDPNTFGTHEFMDFVEQIGSTAYISVNVGSGTPQQAADWIEYMTAAQPTALARERAANGRTEPWKVHLLGLGNETWGCGGEMSAERSAEEMKRFGTFVKSWHPEQAQRVGVPAPDPMLRVAVGHDDTDLAFGEAAMKAWSVNPFTGATFDALSLHYYTADGPPMSAPSTGFDEGSYARILRNTLKMDRMIAEHAAMMDRYDPNKQVALSIDEWGVWLRPEGEPFMFLRQQNSIRDALAAALNLNIFARHADRVRVANIAQMVNVIQSLILTDGPRMVLTPTYHVYRMYVPFQGAQALPVTLAAGEYRHGEVRLPRLDAIAAKAPDGAVWLAVTNLDPNQAAQIDTSAMGIRARAAVGEVLTAPKVDTVNTFEDPNAVAPRPVRFVAKQAKLAIDLPPKSLTVVRIEP